MSTLLSIKPYLSLPFLGVILPEITVQEHYKNEVGAKSDASNADFLKQLCRDGFKRKIAAKIPKDKHKEYGDRVKLELETIDVLGFTNYILMVWDICRFADEKQIPRGPGRGSVGSSLVCYLIGITNIDPVLHGLFFTRFLSKARAKTTVIDGVRYVDGSLTPDVDMDFDYYRRQEVVVYLNERYTGQTAKLLTTTTFTSKILIKDVLKSFEGVPEDQAAVASDLIEKEAGNPEEIEDALSEDEDKQNLRFKDWAKDHVETCEIAMGLSGLNRAEGMHASALLICSSKIRELMPLQLSSDKEMISGYDMYSAQEMTLKFDLLGLKTLSVIKDVCDLVKIKPEDIDMNHPSIYEQLQDFKHRYGIFQFETFAQGGAAAKVKPKNFDQIAAVLAVARPGAFAYIDQLAKYVNEGVYNSIDPLIDDILKPTGGICLYQESLLAMVNKLGMELEECEGLRRAIGKKDPTKIKDYKEKIYAIAEKNNHSKKLADLIWKIAEDSGGYQFNKSHSFCYATITATTLYLKAQYPLQFYWGLLRMARNETDGHSVIAQIEKEMRAQGFKLLPPDLERSSIDFKIEDAKSIRFALGMIRGVSEKTMEKLETFRAEGGKVTNKFEAFQAIKNAGLNIGIGSALIQAGCLAGYGKSRSRVVLELQTFNLLTDKEKSICLAIGHKPEVNWDVLNAIVYLRDHTDERGKPLFSRKTRFDTIKKKYEPYKKIYEMNRRNERLANFFYEKTILGYSYSENLRGIFGEHTDGLMAVAEAVEADPEENVRLIGFVSEIFKGKTKAGNDQLRFKLSDETGEITVRIFNDNIKRIVEYDGRQIEENDLVILNGRKKDGQVVFANDLGIQTATIYMRLSELKDKGGSKSDTEVPAVPATAPDQPCASQ